jgi:hypothetical protein
MRTFAPRRNQAHKQASSTPARSAIPCSAREPASLSRSLGLQLDLTRIPSVTRPLQRQPAVSSPGDPFEREADEAAEKVLRMAEPAPIGPGPAGIQRQCPECEDEEKKKRLQTKPSPVAGAGSGFDTEKAIRVAGQGGTSLPAEVRAYFEPRFGHDFSRVRVHADGEAAEGARAVRARAFTLGRDIVFGSGEYAPGTLEGRRLLAHELVHVVQQSAAGSTAGTPLARQAAEKTEEDAAPQAAARHPSCSRGDAGRRDSTAGGENPVYTGPAYPRAGRDGGLSGRATAEPRDRRVHGDSLGDASRG